jgi:hypothetical protein
MAGHIDLLANWRAAHGFFSGPQPNLIPICRPFHRWLDQKGLSAQQIDEALHRVLLALFAAPKGELPDELKLTFEVADESNPEVFSRVSR